MYSWDVYEISSEKHSLTGVMCRGRIRKFALGQSIDLLTENASDKQGLVRFAIETGTSPELIKGYLRTIFDDIQVELVLEEVQNPVLSKLKVNKEERYAL